MQAIQTYCGYLEIVSLPVDSKGEMYKMSNTDIAQTIDASAFVF